MMIFAVERWSVVESEIVPFFKPLAKESGIITDRENVSLETYRGCSKAEGLLLVTARENGDLVGFIVSFIAAHPHWKDVRMAMTDMIYLEPSARKGRNFLRMLEFCKTQVKLRGASYFLASLPARRAHGKILERAGWKEWERIYVSNLED